MPQRLSISAFVFTAVIGSSIAAQSAEPATTPRRPNILWITCEDISPDLGCYGNEYASTPALDRLARRGVRYLNAYGITGVCAPNRSCLITGVYPSTLGSHNMRSTTRLPEHIKCFSENLRSAGYYCTNNVKTDYNFATPKTAWDDCSRKGHWRNRQPGRPFFHQPRPRLLRGCPSSYLLWAFGGLTSTRRAFFLPHFWQRVGCLASIAWNASKMWPHALH